MKYEYMVIYNFPQGMGRIRITSDKKIKCFEDVENVEKIVKRDTGKNDLVVTNFKLLRIYK